MRAITPGKSTSRRFRWRGKTGATGEILQRAEKGMVIVDDRSQGGKSPRKVEEGRKEKVGRDPEKCDATCTVRVSKMKVVREAP